MGQVRFSFLPASKNLSTLTHFIRHSNKIFFALMAYGQHGHGLAILNIRGQVRITFLYQNSISTPAHFIPIRDFFWRA
jgi:hypothetical protein